ncbi:Crp/Fnr family transcriptional regulator [Tropicibacter oceani]|uniref:Crp/Fnr family transcriptional regulator n=1 Tax=Tropicibacter oceani TaxID=3058420 RepID=A0ABY8QLI2_9RHOB|nr:Crp/Fnr family transcriptional regulator [Tropicibacter oceani]WGW05505.1 Crp/Fnr family transcriptional regulator [Tropicibacter oceani]
MDGPISQKQTSILFESLPARDAAALRAMGRPMHYQPQAQICAEGSDDQSMLLIETGRVEISLTSVDGRRSILAQLGPGEVVGEMAALDGEPRSADAEAAVDVTGLLLTRSQVQRFLRDHPDAALQVIRTLCARLRKTNTRLATQVLSDGPSRLAGLLGQLFEDWGTPDAMGHLHLSEGFSQSDLGDMTGLTRETVNRAIRSWEKDGIVRRDGRSLVLLDPALLAKRAF